MLFISMDDPRRSYVLNMMRGLQETLAEAPQPPLLYLEFFDDARFGDVSYEEDYLTWLARKYRNRRIDVVLTSADAVLRLLARQAGPPLGDVPIVHASVGPPAADVLALLPTTSIVVVESNLPAVIATVRQVRPQAHRFALVYGASVVDRFRGRAVATQLERVGLPVLDLGGLPMEALLQQVRRLPPDTVPLLLGVQVDGPAGTSTIQAGRPPQRFALPAHSPARVPPEVARRLVARDRNVRLGDVVDAAVGARDREHRGPGCGVDVDGPRSDRRVEARARSIEEPVAEDDTVERRLDHLALEAHHGARGLSVHRVAHGQQRVFLTVRHGPLRVDEGDALGDEPPGASNCRGRDEVSRALLPQARIAHQRLGHLARLEGVRQVGELVHHHLGLGVGQGLPQGAGVEDVDHDRLDPHLTQHGPLVR
jgi:hypothetical protein